MSPTARRLSPLLLGAVLATCSKGATAPGAAHTLTVSVRDDIFVPKVDSVSVGDTVTWVWSGAQLHDLAFQDSIGNVAAQTSGSARRVFTAPGIYLYRCTLHSTDFVTGSMIGSVAVY